MLALEQWAESGTFIAPGTGVVRPPPPPWLRAWKRFKMRPKLLLFTSRKSYTVVRLVPKLTKIIDLEVCVNKPASGSGNMSYSVDHHVASVLWQMLVCFCAAKYRELWRRGWYDTSTAGLA